MSRVGENCSGEVRNSRGVCCSGSDLNYFPFKYSSLSSSLKTSFMLPDR